MQRLLSSAVWDTDGVRDELRTYTLEYLGTTSAIVVIDAREFSQTGEQVGRRRGAVVRNHWTGRELSGGRLSVCYSE
jgi:hypothetical protein